MLLKAHVKEPGAQYNQKAGTEGLFLFEALCLFVDLFRESDLHDAFDHGGPAEYGDGHRPAGYPDVVQNDGDEPHEKGDVTGRDHEGFIVGHLYRSTQLPCDDEQGPENHKEAAPKSCEENSVIHYL